MYIFLFSNLGGKQALISGNLLSHAKKCGTIQQTQNHLFYFNTKIKYMVNKFISIKIGLPQLITNS